jgi:cytoskeleton protein RodZ
VSVGEALTRAREERGLTVEDVTAATRIRAGLIRSIENDQFDACGGAVYARGHIRNIARALDVDPAPLVEEFDAAHADEAPPAPALVPAATVDPQVAHSEPKRPNWTAAMVVALVAIIVLAAVSLVTGHDGSPRQAAHDRQPTPNVTTPPASTPGSPPASAVARVDPNSAVALVRVHSGTTWLSVETLSGRVLFQGLLAAGAHKVFKDDGGLRLTIGNAPSVDLVANGRDLGAPRSQGNVAHVTIQRGGDVQFA